MKPRLESGWWPQAIGCRALASRADCADEPLRGMVLRFFLNHETHQTHEHGRLPLGPGVWIIRVSAVGIHGYAVP
jgi:hypothetical protein